jgi:putative redox protein
MGMTATARRTKGLQHEIDVNGRHTITTDEPLALGGTDTGPAPHELLPATLASCVSTMVALYAQRKGWELEDLRVDVTYDTEATPRRFTVELQLPAGLSADQVQRLRRVADGCPVRRALEAGFAFEERILVGDDVAADAA